MIVGLVPTSNPLFAVSIDPAYGEPIFRPVHGLATDEYLIPSGTEKDFHRVIVGVVAGGEHLMGAESDPYHVCYTDSPQMTTEIDIKCQMKRKAIHDAAEAKRQQKIIVPAKRVVSPFGS